eukprot:11209157-Lingulodinium_polyedra.AAC.1
MHARPGVVITRDDKDKHGCWLVPRAAFEASCLLYVANNKMWRLANLTAQAANVRLFEVLAELVPARLQRAMQ